MKEYKENLWYFSVILFEDIQQSYGDYSKLIGIMLVYQVFDCETYKHG